MTKSSPRTTRLVMPTSHLGKSHLKQLELHVELRMNSQLASLGYYDRL